MSERLRWMIFVSTLGLFFLRVLYCGFGSGGSDRASDCRNLEDQQGKVWAWRPQSRGYLDGRVCGGERRNPTDDV